MRNLQSMKLGPSEQRLVSIFWASGWKCAGFEQKYPASDIGAALGPSSGKILIVEEAVILLLQHFLSSARVARSHLDGNEED